MAGTVNLGVLELLLKIKNEMGPDLANATKGLAAAAAGMFTAAKAAQFLESCLEAQGESVANINKLNLALVNQGTFSEKTSQSLIDYASAMQDVTAFSDDAVVAGEATLASFGMNEEQIKKTTKAAADFAAATGTDLQSAIDLLGKAYAGNTAALGRYGIVIDESVPKAQRFDSAVAQLNQRFGGSAQTDAQSYAGQMKQLANTWDDVKESIGKFLGELAGGVDGVGTFSGALKEVSSFFGSTLVIAVSEVRAQILEWMATLADASGPLKEIALLAARAFDPLNFTGIHTALRDIANSGPAGAKAMREQATAIRDAGDRAAAASGHTKTYTAAEIAAAKAAADSAKKAKDLAEAHQKAAEATKKHAEAVKQLADELSGKNAADKMKLLTEAMAQVGPLSNLSEAGFKAVSAQLKDMTEWGVKAGGSLGVIQDYLSKPFVAPKLPDTPGPFTDIAIPDVLDLNKMAKQTAEDFASTFAGSLKTALKDLPNVIMGALQGGGNLFKSAGGLFGASIFGEGSNLVKGLTSKLSGVLGKTVGGAIGSMLPGIGTILGGAVGGLADKVFGGLFNSEGKKVRKMRDEFIESAGGLDVLKKKAQEAGVDLDDLLNAKKVKGFQSAVEDLSGAFKLHDDAIQKTTEAAERYGLTIDELGPKFKQQKLDEQFGQLLQDWELLSASGADMTAVATKMAPSMNEYVQTVKKAGASIPESMRPALEQMLKLGLLTDESGKKLDSLDGLTFEQSLTEGIKSVTDAVYALVKALGGDVPDAAKKAGTAISGIGGPGGAPASANTSGYGAPPPGGYGSGYTLPEHAAAMGFDGMVNGPTRFLAGEAGPERVTITPSGRGGGDRGTERVEMLLSKLIDVTARAANAAPQAWRTAVQQGGNS